MTLHGQQYINYHCKDTLFNIDLFVYVMVLYLVYINWLFTNLFLFHFQTKDRDMHVYALAVAKQWWQKLAALEHVSFITLFVLINSAQCYLLVSYYSVAFFRWVKETTKTTTFVYSLFFYNMILYWLRNLAICISFL